MPFGSELYDALNAAKARNAGGLAVGDINPATGQRVDAITAAPTQQNPLLALFTSLLAGHQQNQQQGGIPWDRLLEAANPTDFVGQANRLTGLPSYAPGSQSPFNTGYFKTGAQRAAAPFEGTSDTYHPAVPYATPARSTVAPTPFTVPALTPAHVGALMSQIMQGSLAAPQDRNRVRQLAASGNWKSLLAPRSGSY